MGHRVVDPSGLPEITRPHGDGEPTRRVPELTESAGLREMRANVWRCEPGAAGRRHRHPVQQEAFLVLAGTLSTYVGERPERADAPTGRLICVDPGTPRQTGNHGGEELVVLALGHPPEESSAELLPGAV